MYNIYSSYPPELYHHGIKGQKWGVRRFQNKSNSNKKRMSSMTNDELRRATERKRLENAYKAEVYNSKRNSTSRKLMSKGAKIVGAIVGGAAIGFSKQIVQYYGATYINDFLGEEVVSKKPPKSNKK